MVRTGYFVTVAPERSSIRIISFVLMGVGLAAIAAGIVLIIVGKKVAAGGATAPELSAGAPVGPSVQ